MMAKRRRGQHLEIILETAVDALGGISRDAHQIVGVTGDELRIGAEELEEVGEAALEAGFGHGALHVGVDARDFLEAELVDVLGRHGQRGIFADFGAVISIAIGQVARADGLARAGDIGVAVEGQQVAIGGDDGLLDRRLALGAQPGLVGGADGRRHLLEGAVKSVGVGRGGEGGDRSFAAAERDRGRA